MFEQLLLRHGRLIASYASAARTVRTAVEKPCTVAAG